MESDMDGKEVGPKGPVVPPEEQKLDVVESMMELYTGGIHRLAEIQKKGLEIALLQNSEVAGNWKKFKLASPAVLMLDLTTAAFERFAETQKAAIELVVQQTDTFAKLVKERKVNTIDTLEEGKKTAKEAIEHSVAAQKTALDYTARQAKAVFETAKQQLGYVGTPAAAAADSMQRSMEVVVDAQKQLLDELVTSTLH